MSRRTGRSWCFTWNNPPVGAVGRLEALLENPVVKYVCFGVEHGEEKKTPHFQGYLQLTDSRKPSYVHRLLPGCHVELMKGTAAQAIAYCRKDGDFHEFGDPPVQGSRSDLLEVKRKLDEGATEEEIAAGHFGSWVRYNSSFAKYRLLKRKRHCVERKVYWFYGATGTGKSTVAAEMLPNAYWKSPGKWFDGYDGEDEVIIDDIRHDDISYHMALRLFQAFPVAVPVKCSTVPWLATTIIVTAPCHPKDLWNTSEDLAQLTRRIFEIREFKIQHHLAPPSPVIHVSGCVNLSAPVVPEDVFVADSDFDEEDVADDEIDSPQLASNSVSRFAEVIDLTL